MPFGKSKGHPVDYLIAASVHVSDTGGLSYSDEFQQLVTNAFMPFDPTKSAEVFAKRTPDAYESAATEVIREAVRLAISRRDGAAVPAIIGLGVPLAMRFTMYLNMLLDEEIIPQKQDE